MKERTYIVYKHTSPTNKVYIGITHTKPEYRWSNGNGYRQNKHFWSAITKYGWDNFTHEILYVGLSRKEAYEKEIELIKYYQSNDRRYGYNNSIGGEKSCVGARYKRGSFTMKHKKSLQAAWVKRKEKGLGVPWNKGLNLKDSGVLDNFIAAGLRNAEEQRKAVYQIDRKTNSIIAMYPSAIEAARTLGKSYATSITMTLKGNRKSAFGYFWKYVED